MDIKNDDYIRSLFLENGQKLKFKMGQSLSDDNYLSGSIYYIENGSARVIYKDENKFKTISKISNGCCVGAISIIRFSACENIRASTELLTFKISDKQFNDFYNKDLKFKEFFDSNIYDSEVIHFANYLNKNLLHSKIKLEHLFKELKNSFQSYFYNLEEIIELIKTGKKIHLAQKIEGFDLYFLIDNEDKANNLFKDSNDKRKIRFISSEYDLKLQNNVIIDNGNKKLKLLIFI